LSSKSYLGYIEIRVFSHATEDPSKVLISVKNLFPIESREDLVFNKTQLSGYYNNPIILYKIRINENPLLQSIIQFISENLSFLDKEYLTNNIKIHLDRNNLYLRFDKQLAYNSKVKFSKQDSIHLKIHFNKKNFKDIVELCKKVGLII
jgi:RNA binding exosome subunit